VSAGTNASAAPPGAPAGCPSTGVDGHARTLIALFFASGFAALVYQVLWVRELGLLFGSTAQAAALTIAIFFTGIAWGGWFWGRRAPRLDSSLRWFGILEVGVAATALGHFLLVDAYVALYPAVFAVVGDSVVFDTLAKAGVASVVLLPPAFLMGGTLPLMAQHLIRDPARLGTTGSALYAVNTLGSATGALAAGFVLPLALGFRGAYLLAVGIDLAVGVSAIVIARSRELVRSAPTPIEDRPGARERHDAVPPRRPRPEPSPAGREGPPIPTGVVWAAAFVSGFATLAVEVVWTRLFSQVLQNSAYTYALVLATFLLALSLGATLANALIRLRGVTPELVLGGLLVGSSAVIAVSPWLFTARTDGLTLLGPQLDFGPYVVAVVGVAVVVMLLPGIVLGAVLPYLLRTLQSRTQGAGDTIGRLVAVNTTGGILGSLLAGFVLLPQLGTWRTLLLLAAVYPVLVAAVALGRLTASRFTLAAAAGVTALALVATAPAGLAVVRLSPAGAESLVEVREGPQATVAVIEDRDGDLSIRVNNHYTLGGTRGSDSERNQSVIPMLSHPDPANVFYLGLGTGITAGAGLRFPVERVVVCELIRDVVEVAEAHFGPWTGGLFDDDRATVTAEDGRTCLSRSDDRYDLIVSDLFVPWEAGTGNLYTLEHYETARDRLRPGGRYVQWVPLYQVSDNELGIIGRTMDEAFDQVTVWRGDLFSERSIVALVGEQDPSPLDPTVLADRGRDLLGGTSTSEPLPDAFFEAVALRMYAGNLTASGIYADRELNTDTYPRVEYEAPRTQRAVRAGEAEFLVGDAREQLYDRLQRGAPPERDPYLTSLDDRQLGYVHAGRSYSAYRLANARDRDTAPALLDDFLERSPPEARGPQDVSPAHRLLAPLP
jgi:spermidine synthase